MNVEGFDDPTENWCTSFYRQVRSASLTKTVLLGHFFMVTLCDERTNKHTYVHTASWDYIAQLRWTGIKFKAEIQM